MRLSLPLKVRKLILDKKIDGDLTDPKGSLDVPVVAKKKSKGMKSVPKSQDQHFYDPNDHVPEGATKVPLVMPG